MALFTEGADVVSPLFLVYLHAEIFRINSESVGWVRREWLFRLFFVVLFNLRIFLLPCDLPDFLRRECSSLTRHVFHWHPMFEPMPQYLLGHTLVRQVSCKDRSWGQLRPSGEGIRFQLAFCRVSFPCQPWVCSWWCHLSIGIVILRSPKTIFCNIEVKEIPFWVTQRQFFP